MNIHGLFVGIDLYHDTRIPRLQCASRDAQEMCDLFESIGAQATLLLNLRATALAIRRSLVSLARAVGPEDTAIFYFAGHGAKDTLHPHHPKSELIPFLLPCDTIQDDLFGTAIRMDHVGSFLELIRGKNVLFFFDSCYSGTIKNARSFIPIGSRLGAADKGINILPKIAGRGTIIIAASGEYEPAYEDPKIGHGVFTEYLLDALTGGAPGRVGGGVGLDIVYSYLSEKVPEKTSRIYKRKQTPLKHGTEREPVVFPVIQRSPVRTLVDFPHAFLPISVVIGDRREKEPKTRGDLFALSASPAELRWIHSLGLPQDTEIIPDKIFMTAGEKYIQENYGLRNLLVIGSPAANHVARLANETAFFPFAVDPGVYEQWKKMSAEISEIGDDRTKLTNYSYDPRINELLRFYMNQYRKGGFIDPTYTFVKRGETIPYDRDYGVVTISKNPFEPDSSGNFCCILAAGVHLPGTMHAIALLGEARSEFKNRPLGGIFSVHLEEAAFEKRIAGATPRWSTEEYKLKSMYDALMGLNDKERKRYAPGILSEAFVKSRLELLRLLNKI